MTDMLPASTLRGMADPSGPEIVSYTNDEARKLKGQFNEEILRNTTGADIERYKIEDDFPPPEHRGPLRFPNAQPDVAKLRATFGISQEEFARRFGLSLRTLQEWEQKRRAPDGPARLLLRIIADEPEAAERVARTRASEASSARLMG